MLWRMAQRYGILIVPKTTWVGKRALARMRLKLLTTSSVKYVMTNIIPGLLTLEETFLVGIDSFFYKTLVVIV